MQNKCEELKMKHAWKNTTPNIVYATYPPQYPCRQDTCLNCGLVRTFREKLEKWIEYSDGVKRSESSEFTGNLTILSGDGLTGTEGTTYVTNI